MYGALLGGDLHIALHLLIAHQRQLECVVAVLQALKVEGALHVGHAATSQFAGAVGQSHGYKLQCLVVLFVEHLTSHYTLCLHVECDTNKK